jgi:hypothetical protein
MISVARDGRVGCAEVFSGTEQFVRQMPGYKLWVWRRPGLLGRSWRGGIADELRWRSNLADDDG